MNNEVIKAIKERRTVRNFEDKPISDDVLKTVLEAIQWAPSWANTQCWEVVVVKDPDIKTRLQDEAIPKSNPAHKAVGNAPVVLAMCARLNESGYYKNNVTTKFGDWFMFDLGLAAQNLSIAAHAMGLGSVIMGLFEQDKAAAVLNLPENHELVTLIPMGYPSKVPSAPKRREMEEFTREDTF
ncbi:MAG: nitroreductase family protein [Spirochaetales bacterium]|jgi:nitroreductase|nr:nitroreductase family protein [Spirochaetales bacterium]